VTELRCERSATPSPLVVQEYVQCSVPPRLSPKGIIPSQRLSFRPGFLGRGLHGRYPPSPVPAQGFTFHPGRNAGRHDAHAAREQAAKPPAGTALAPMTRCASAPRPSRAKMRSGHTPPQRQPIASNRKCPKSPAGLILRRRATSPAVSQHRRRADAGFTVHLSRRRRGLRVAQILPAHKIREDASLHSRAGASL
jgi:hypothetical protein